MAGVAQEVGQVFRGGIKLSTVSWNGVAMVLGSGDGVEFNSESLAMGQEVILNKGMLGSGFMRPGVLGNRKPGGDEEYNAYFVDPLMQVLFAAFGSDAVTNPAAGVYVHQIAIQPEDLDIFFTVANFGSLYVEELNTAKLTALTFMGDSEGDGQWCKFKPSWSSADMARNVGASDDDYFVASVTVADGARTLLNSGARVQTDLTKIPFLISEVHASTGSPALTEAIETIVCIDEFGVVHSLVYTHSTDLWALDGGTGVAGNAAGAYTGMRFQTILSVTTSGTVGTGTVKIGMVPGVNTLATASSVTTESTRKAILTTGLRVWANLQDGADFDAAIGGASINELDVAGFEIGLPLAHDDRHTSITGRYRAQPTRGGTGYPQPTVKLKFSSLSAREIPRLFDGDQARQLKMKFEITGPRIGSTAYNYKLEFFLNCVQATGEPNVGGPGLMAFDWAGQANEALTAPTGVFPSGMTAPIGVRLTTSVSGAYIS